MLKNRKIELQAKTISRFKDENIRLYTENRELKKQLQEQSALIHAAEKYREEHQKILHELNEAKERYNEAVREIVGERKRYREEFREYMKEIK